MLGCAAATIVRESDGKRVFIRGFSPDGGRSKFFLSATIEKDNETVVVSSHLARAAQVQKKIESGELVYSTALSASDAEPDTKSSDPLSSEAKTGLTVNPGCKGDFLEAQLESPPRRYEKYGSCSK